MNDLRLFLLMIFAAGFSGSALAQQPTSVNDLVDHILLEIEGPQPRWEMTETEQQLRQIFSEEVYDEFIRSIRRLRLWHDERSSEMLGGYISRLKAGEGSQRIRDLQSSLVQLQQLISPGNAAAQPYTPPPPVFGAAPEGVTVTGRIQSRIEGHWNPAFAGGLVFALSTDTRQILGFSYTTDTAFRDGYFQIDGLPKQNHIVLIAFAPAVKRLHWIDSISLGDLAKSDAVHQRMDIGTVYATLDVPSAGSPHDLSGAGTVVLQGKTAALQLLALAGWLADRRSLPDYSRIDELTNRLYGYYTDGIENYIQNRETLPLPADRHDTVPVHLNVPYHVEDPGSNFHTLYFMNFDGEQLIVQQGDGNVIAPIPYGFGIKHLENMAEFEPDEFIAKWYSGMGFMSAHYRFGINQRQRYYVDYTCDACDEPVRFYSNPEAEMPVCTAENAAATAADYFSPGCSFNLPDYRPVATVNLNHSGRLAYIFPSCAGPHTRGNFTYVVIERRMECKVIGNFTTSDPNPSFSIEKDELVNYNGRQYERAVIYPLQITASNMQTRFEFDVDTQQYRQAVVRPVTTESRDSVPAEPPVSAPLLEGLACPAFIDDIDGNRYPVIKIGSDCWMARNLNTGRYRNGEGIPHIPDGVFWSRQESGAWVYYNNEPNNQHDFGKLYNGYAARDPRGVCPQGWQMPTDSQWSTVSQALREDSPLQTAAQRMLESLREQPGGARFFSGPNNQRSLSPFSLSQTNSEFNNIRYMGFWLGNLNRGGRVVSTFNVGSTGNSILADANHMAGGYSIRCVSPAR